MFVCIGASSRVVASLYVLMLVVEGLQVCMR